MYVSEIPGLSYYIYIVLAKGDADNCSTYLSFDLNLFPCLLVTTQFSLPYFVITCVNCNLLVGNIISLFKSLNFV